MVGRLYARASNQGQGLASLTSAQTYDLSVLLKFRNKLVTLSHHIVVSVFHC